MHDRFKKRYHVPQGTARLRQQIALEAARRMYAATAGEDVEGTAVVRDATEGDYYAAKRKAAAVLGHRVRPGDLPSDSEVRAQVLALARSRAGALPVSDGPDADAEPPALAELADHVDRFVIYKLRLAPLESVKQNPKYHPEGDALFHSLQVFALAREARPYDEEFLLAALLHDVGKAIDSAGHAEAAVEALRGAVTERTLWLIDHHMDLLAARERTLGAKARRALERSEYFDDLRLLRELDEAGRVPGVPVVTIDQALDYVRGLEREDYLNDGIGR